MKAAAFYKIAFFLVALSGIAIAVPFFLYGELEKTSVNKPSFELFVSTIDRNVSLDRTLAEDDRSFARNPGNSFNAYQPNQKFLVKIKFNHPWKGDDLSLQVRPAVTLVGAHIYSKDLILLDSHASSSGGAQINTSTSGLKFRQVGESQTPELFMEINNRFSEVVSISVEKNHNIYGDMLFNSGLYLGVALVCALLPLFFYFQYKQKIFLLLSILILNLMLKFLLINALISSDYFEFHGIISSLVKENFFFYLNNLLESLFLIYLIKLIIKNKYLLIGSIINFSLLLIIMTLSRSTFDSVLLNTYYICNYLLILLIFLIYTKNLKINRFIYLIGYGIQFFALYLLFINYHLIESPIDYINNYFSILPLAYYIFFMYLIVHHCNLALTNKIYEQNQLNKKAIDQLEVSNTVNNSQVLLLEAISHELKSPLMALYFLIDNISTSGMGLVKETQRFKSTLNQIVYIVERFSSLSKFYSINEVDVKKNINVNTLIASLIEIRSEHKSINLNASIDAIVESDFVLLQIVFQNLIENAIKYRSDTDSLIDINIIQLPNNFLQVDISNSLHKNIRFDLDKIFDMYYRGSNVKNQPGMGVGLWITKEIIKKIKAEINVSRRGDKVIFSVFIPLCFPY